MVGSILGYGLHSSTTDREGVALDRILNTEEFAAYLGISRTALYALKHKGALPPAIRVGASLRWTASSIEKWMNENTEPSQ